MLLFMELVDSWEDLYADNEMVVRWNLRLKQPNSVLLRALRSVKTCASECHNPAIFKKLLRTVVCIYNQAGANVISTVSLSAMRDLEKRFPKLVQSDKGFILAVVEQYEWKLQHASEKLRKDKEVVLAAVNLNGMALKHVSEELRMDAEVVVIVSEGDEVELGGRQESEEGDDAAHGEADSGGGGEVHREARLLGGRLAVAAGREDVEEGRLGEDPPPLARPVAGEAEGAEADGDDADADYGDGDGGEAGGGRRRGGGGGGAGGVDGGKGLCEEVVDQVQHPGREVVHGGRDGGRLERDGIHGPPGRGH